MGGLLTAAAPARASSIAPTCQLLAPGGGSTCPSAAPMFMVPGQYNYGDSFSAPTASGSISGSNIYGGPATGNLGPAGFIDDYYFKIAPASADAVSATISDGDFAITNLFATIYSLTSNPDGLVLSEPVGTVYYGDITASGAASFVQINPVTLEAGSYVLQISGTASGTLGGSYTGTLNLDPVPLPGSLPLLLSALLAFAGFILPRHRSR